MEKDKWQFVDITPFQILGIEPTDNQRIIADAYRRMIRMVHPDKKVSGNYANYWNEKDRTQAFQNVREAYKTLTRDYQFKDVPDYDIVYEFDNMTLDPTELQRPGERFDQNAFNRNFNIRKEKSEHAGMQDPNSLGYNDFNRPNLSKTQLEAMLTREYKPVNSKIQTKQRQLVKHNPRECFLGGDGLDCYELGVSKIDNYGFESRGKNGLGGTDLQQVWSQNNEPWETTVMRNKSMYNKYTKEEKLSKVLSRMKTDRTSLEVKDEYAKALDNYEKSQRQEKIDMARRMEIQKTRDDWNSRLYIKNGGNIENVLRR